MLSYFAYLGDFVFRQTEPEAITCSFLAFIKLAASSMVNVCVFKEGYQPQILVMVKTRSEYGL